MVGVPGRSKGCLTCRKRKIRCDLGRPTCNQCQRTKRLCSGYEKSTIFFNKSSRGFDLHSRGIPEITYSVTEPSQHPGQPSSSPRRVSQRSGDGLSLSMPKSLNMTLVLQNVVLAEFVDSTLPKGATREPPLSWITSILDSANCNETLSLAGSAIGYGWTGHIEARFDRVMEGRRCYSQAMSHLRKDLAREQVPTSETTLATTCALVLYELIEFGTYDAQGWHAHTSGIEMIVSQTSAQTFVAGSSHKVFLFCRFVIILRSLLHRRATFLGENEWRHIPWTLYPKDAFHQLLDLAAEVAALLEIYDAHKTSWTAGTCDVHTFGQLLVKIALMVSHLRRWHADLNIRLPQEPLFPVGNEGKTDVLKVPIQRSANCHWYPARQHPNIRVSVEGLQQARSLLFYWAVVLTLQTEVFRSRALRAELYQAYSLFDTADSSQDIEKDIRASISIDLAIEFADNIVRWFQYAAQDVWNSFGPAFGVFSLRAAITWYLIYRELPQSRMSLRADRSKQLQQAQSMLLRLVNHGSPPTYYD